MTFNINFPNNGVEENKNEIVSNVEQNNFKNYLDGKFCSSANNKEDDCGESLVWLIGNTYESVQGVRIIRKPIGSRYAEALKRGIRKVAFFIVK